MAAFTCDAVQRCDCRLYTCKICNPDPDPDFTEITKLKKAIHDIAPWLSASLSDKSCEEYVNACNQVFALDT